MASGTMKAGATVRMRLADLGDSAHLLTWRNDPDSVAQSLSAAEVDAASHAAWLEAVLADPARILLIGEVDGQAVGMVRLDIRVDRGAGGGAAGGGAAEVSINLASDARGRGLSSALLLAGEEYLETHKPGERPSRLTACIKSGNTASRRAFERAGYLLISPETDAVLNYDKPL